MYHIEKTIGYGGMATVYLGRHTLLGRAAAIKVLLPQPSRNRETVERFFNEARTLSRITDPGIVQVFDFGHLSDGRAFIVMEFLEGESIHARLKRIPRLDAAACLRLSRLLCGSLAAVHAKGIIHRDLRPGNIFIVNDASVPGGERTKIFDFGIAKQTRDAAGMIQARAGTLTETPLYMSPEQCRGERDVDHRSDIYSIGCVMFTMLAGQPPFGGRPPQDLVVAHLREPAPLASSIAPEVPAIVDDILQRCLKKSPEDRYQSMTELAHAIGAAEQLLTAATTPVVPAVPANVRARSSMEPSLGIALPMTNQAGMGGPDSTTSHGAGVRSIAPAVRGNSRRRRWTAGAVIVTASLLGVLCAFVISRDAGHDGAPLQEPSTAQAATRSSPRPQRQPDVVGPAAPGLPTSAPVNHIAGSLGVGGAGKVVPPPPPPTPPTPPGTAGRPSPDRPRPGGQQLSNHDTKGDHANPRQRSAPPNADLQRAISQNVTRGD
jgi:serine/threonine-protein kinase